MLYIIVCVCICLVYVCVCVLHSPTRRTTLKTFDLLCTNFKHTCVCLCVCVCMALDRAQARASARTLMQMHPNAAAVDAAVAVTVTLPHPEKTAFFYKRFWIFRFSFCFLCFAFSSLLLLFYFSPMYNKYSLASLFSAICHKCMHAFACVCVCVGALLVSGCICIRLVLKVALYVHILCAWQKPIGCLQFCCFLSRLLLLQTRPRTQKRTSRLPPTAHLAIHPPV